MQDPTDDQNPDEGYYEGYLYWGQTAVDDLILEDYVLEYKVYIVDSFLRKLGPPVGSVPRRLVAENRCCQLDAYAMPVSTMLPVGYDRFMVVPVTVAGNELGIGSTSSPIIDNLSSRTTFAVEVPHVVNFSLILPLPAQVYAGNGSLVISPANATISIQRMLAMNLAVSLPCTQI